MGARSLNAKMIVRDSKMEYSGLNSISLHSNKQSNLLKYRDITNFTTFLANLDIW